MGDDYVSYYRRISWGNESKMPTASRLRQSCSILRVRRFRARAGGHFNFPWGTRVPSKGLRIQFYTVLHSGTDHGMLRLVRIERNVRSRDF